LKHLPDDRYTSRDIYIDKQGLWHLNGVPTTAERVLPSLDIAILPLHGEGGQDGEIQRTLERFGTPYTGADSYSAFLASHKMMAKERALAADILTAKYRFVQPEDDAEAAARDIIRSFHQPVVVKPVKWGSSVGVSMVGGYAPVLSAIEELIARGAGGVLVEERIKGREATVGIINGMRGEELYALPPVEIVPPPGSDFFDYDVKYNGATREICPGHFSRAETAELIRMARVMHRELGQRHYSRSDFIISPRGIYFLETNTAAAVGLTEESLFPKALAAVGIKFGDFLSHIIDSTLERPLRAA
jgi:D-alanine-D-alanine ligase